MQLRPSSDNLTKFLAAWGALLGTFGLGWTLYRDLLDRAKLQLSAKVRRIARGLDGKYFAVAHDSQIPASEKLFVVMSVVNVGRRPVMWQGWGGRFRKPQAGVGGFFIVGKNLPKMLQEANPTMK